VLLLSLHPHVDSAETAGSTLAYRRDLTSHGDSVAASWRRVLTNGSVTSCQRRVGDSSCGAVFRARLAVVYFYAS
jgi:hypothetical protein